MAKRFRTLADLKDSRLMMEKKIPTFGYMIVLTVLALLIVITIWSMKANKIYVIKTAGTVTNTGANYVMSSFSGTIKDSQLEEGKIVNKDEYLFEVVSSDIDMQQKQLEESTGKYETQIEQYEKLVKSIQDDVNYFDAASAEDSLYYSTFETYKSQVKQNKTDTALYKAYGYSDEQINAELEKSSAKTSELYYTAIQNAETRINEAKTQISNIEAQLKALESGENSHKILAPNEGTLHLLAAYKDGMVVQSGSAIATITPENEKPIIEAYIPPQDMARMHVGDLVEMEVGGLMQSVYGNIVGKVTSIDSNSTVQESQNEKHAAFKISVEPDTNYLVGKSGEKINILNGMTVEIRIQYKKVTYFDYIMQKIGFASL